MTFFTFLSYSLNLSNNLLAQEIIYIAIFLIIIFAYFKTKKSSFDDSNLNEQTNSKPELLTYWIKAQDLKILKIVFSIFFIYVVLNAISLLTTKTIKDPNVNLENIDKLSSLYITSTFLFFIIPVSILIFYLIDFRHNNIIDIFGLKNNLSKLFFYIFSALLIIFFTQIIVDNVFIKPFFVKYIWGKIESQSVIEIFKNTDSFKLKFIITISACIIAPITEEIWFRGYFYKILKKYNGKIPAIIITSLFFSLIHYHLPTFVPLFLLSVIIIWAYEKSQNLLVPIFIHASFNSIMIMLLFFYDAPEITK